MICYRPAGSKETIRLFTSLVETEITKEELAALYHERWEEETVIDEIVSVRKCPSAFSV